MRGREKKKRVDREKYEDEKEEVVEEIGREKVKQRGMNQFGSGLGSRFEFVGQRKVKREERRGQDWESNKSRGNQISNLKYYYN